MNIDSRIQTIVDKLVDMEVIDTQNVNDLSKYPLNVQAEVLLSYLQANTDSIMYIFYKFPNFDINNFVGMKEYLQEISSDSKPKRIRLRAQCECGEWLVKKNLNRHRQTDRHKERMRFKSRNS